MVDFGLLIFANNCDQRKPDHEEPVYPRLGARSSTITIYKCKLTGKECVHKREDCPRKAEIK